MNIPKDHRYRYCKTCEFYQEQGFTRCKLNLGKAKDDTGLDGKCFIEIAYEQGWKDRDRKDK